MAIIGGGCGALAAAFELSRQKDRYEITVYQQGWRLGGKGASGRGPSGRIEEHALHVWLGFYENAFRMLRACYEELNASGDLTRTWRDEFVADSFVGVADSRVWTALFPPTPGLPGDDLEDEANPFTLQAYFAQMVRLLRALVTVEAAEADEEADTSAPMAQVRAELENRSARELIEDAMRLLKLGILTTTAGLVKVADLVEAALTALPDEERDYNYLVTDFVKEFARATRTHLKPIVESDPAFEFRWHIIDLVLAILVGAVRDQLLIRGLDSINDKACRRWLKDNGASEESLRSPFIRGLFNLAFADRYDIAAGQALRGALRMFFTYRGALFWKMRAGMGDVVFAPLYLLLRKRGVRFEFFHRLEKVNVHIAEPDTDDATYVESLEFDVQAKVKPDPDGKPQEYQPLVEINNRWCWPSAPQWDQLEDGLTTLAGRDFESYWDRRRAGGKVLNVTRDFDFVVLGVSVGAVKDVCGELIADDSDIGRRWKLMQQNVKTVATQSLQIWLRADMQALGWNDQPVTLSGIEDSDVRGKRRSLPFDTWADMSQVVPAEAWPDGAWPYAVAYFCGPLLDDPKNPGELKELMPAPERGRQNLAYVRKRRQNAKENAVAFMNRKLTRLWPAARGGNGEFEWTLLVDASDPQMKHKDAQDAIDSQYVSANINPSDRYVLSLPGTLKNRISPLDESIDNMTIAGDWTDCGFNEGCVEAAVMSGRLAAHAISGSPALEDIVGYDHP